VTPALKPEFAYEATFTPVVPICIHGPVADGAHWMINPDSFPELSTQERLIWLEDTAAAERFDGANGGFGLAASSGTVKSRFKTPINTSRGVGITRVEPTRSGRFVDCWEATLVGFIISEW